MKIRQSQNIDFNSFSAVIFDWGGVITELEPARCIAAFNELGLGTIKNYLNDIRPSNPFIQYETGRIQTPEFVQYLNDDMGKFVNPNLIESAWCKMLGHTPIVRLRLLGILNEKYKTFLLSNTNPSHTHYYLRYLLDSMQFDFGSAFTKMYFSYEMGVMKPHPKIFKMVIEEQQLDVSRTLFLDDRPDNISAARALGLQTIQVGPENPIEILFAELLH